MQTLPMALMLALAGLPQEQHDPGRAMPPQPLSSTPLHIPADFCFGASDTDKRCSVTVAFEVLDSGAVGKVEVVRSSRDRICDRAVMESVRNRRYPPGKPVAVAEETLRTQPCKADGVKR
ncbi:TonB family protein [Xanthomonas bundabergensis]|uniref:TonB family protein n=1 Tax=Xanthomonas bundabergensis TaxID=3160842 RepID=UPI0035159725